MDERRNGSIYEGLERDVHEKIIAIGKARGEGQGVNSKE
jgi:hypothetical protein